MRTKILCFLFFAFLFCGKASAQYAQFPTAGTIYFDKTVYLKNVILKRFLPLSDERSKSWYENIRSKIPESVVLKRKLVFSGDQYTFSAEKNEMEPFEKGLMEQHALNSEGTTFVDLSKKEFKRLADLGGENILLIDSLQDVKWKITNEYRNIAGYECRRANGLTADSIYVVGYFTNNIPVSAGPESVQGLPGLLLGLAIPSMHIQYFATKVEISNVTVEGNIQGKKKTPTMTRKELHTMINKNLSSFMKPDLLNYIMKLYSL
ncbi:GLPGLI family protein [Sphingobacteriaceae bacterium WQ 2009]|uniref:GLPGLI family protein n=1 Tax=Rhinopithecimicrobium faecis TaxID=2820698 RepID=A0A8T4H8F2_9SPHI|nr:GLPGLI family protein [Sphingobacteriaceae bacterium WQ 2009]